MMITWWHIQCDWFGLRAMRTFVCTRHHANGLMRWGFTAFSPKCNKKRDWVERWYFYDYNPHTIDMNGKVTIQILDYVLMEHFCQIALQSIAIVHLSSVLSWVEFIDGICKLFVSSDATGRSILQRTICTNETILSHLNAPINQTVMHCKSRNQASSIKTLYSCNQLR